MTVAIVSSVYGDYDSLKSPVPQTIPCSWVMVTDRPHGVPGWREVVEPRRHLHPRMAAKLAKCRPFDFTSADISIWIDGSARILRDDFAEMCVDSLGAGGVAQWVHPERDCIFDEADVSRLMLKYQGQPVVEQVEHYRQLGHKPHSGLWATGCIVRRRGSWLAQLGNDWLVEQMRWSYQDQLSEPHLIVHKGLPAPDPLPESLWSNQWLAFGHHEGGDR